MPESPSRRIRDPRRAIAGCTILACLAVCAAASADIIHLKNGETIEAEVDGAAEDGSYILILPDGRDRIVPSGDVFNIEEGPPLPLVESINTIQSHAETGNGAAAYQALIGFRAKHPKIGERVRQRLAGLLRLLGERWEAEGDRERAWDAYEAALRYSPGDAEARKAIEALREVSDETPQASLKAYFPLQRGGRWVYDDGGHTRILRLLSVTAVGDGAVEAKIEEKRELASGDRTQQMTIVLDSEGVWRTGEFRERILAEPVELGVQWSEQGEIASFTWEYVEIGGKTRVGETVYSDCLKVRITARTIEYPVEPVVIYRYYARGVGLVKTEWPGGAAHILKDYRIEE